MVRAIALLIACVSVSGCFVFDELDKGNKILDDNFSGGKKASAKPEEKTAAPKAGAGWWANAKSLSGPPTDDGNGKNPVVACLVGKATKFMRRDDCLSQGGRPKS